MSGEVGDARKRNAEPVPTDDVEALGRLLFDIDGWHESHWGDEGDKFRAQARKLLASDWLTAHDAQVRRDATREALTHAKDDIKARIVTFRELNADHQYMNALNDAWGLVANRLRADTAPEPSEHSEPESAQYRELAGQAHTAARAVPTEGEACEPMTEQPTEYVPGNDFTECIREGCPAFHHQYGDRLYFQGRNAPLGVHVTPACASCGEPSIHRIILRGEPTPVCLRHLNHWRTPAPTPPTVGDDEAVEALAEWLWDALPQPVASDFDPAPWSEAGDYNREKMRSQAKAALDWLASRTPSPSVGGVSLAAAVEKVNAFHQFHGDDCLCGFSSARSRSRTEHITAALSRAAAETRGEGSE